MTEVITITAVEYDEIMGRHQWIRSREEFAYLSRGWVGLAVAMLDAMDAVIAENPTAVVTGWYTKEKFGGLRVHFRLDGVLDAASVWAALREPVDSAERASQETCEVCGTPGRLRDSRGWFSTRCDVHAPDRYAPA